MFFETVSEFRQKLIAYGKTRSFKGWCGASGPNRCYVLAHYGRGEGLSLIQTLSWIFCVFIIMTPPLRSKVFKFHAIPCNLTKRVKVTSLEKPTHELLAFHKSSK